MGVLLRGIKREIERGQVLAKPGHHQAARKFESEVYILSKMKAAVILRSSRLPSAVLLPAY